jgi:hypothetical protein
MTDDARDDAPVIDNTRNEQMRKAMKRYRRRRKYGIHRRSIDLTNAQLDALVARGYLDPDRRGDPADECDAIEMFLSDSLTKSR